jgi:hypothetical protein
VLQQVSEAAGRDLVRPAVQLLQAAGLQVEQDVATGDPAHTWWKSWSGTPVGR